MTKEELEKATGQELIDARNYCGIDGYYSSYLDNVNAEMLKRFNRLADIEKENAELKEKLKSENCLKLLAKEGYIKFSSDNLTKAKEIIEKLISQNRKEWVYLDVREEAEQFLKELEK